MPEDDDDLEVSPRGFWSGTISFGLVSVPVALLPATRSNRTSLRMVSPEGTPLSRRYFAGEAEKPLENDDIIRGYEIEKDEFVVVEDEELEKLAPDRSRDIDLRLFFKTNQIDPKYFERAYYLAPSGGSTKAYRLLAKVMEETGRAGIATFVMRGKEYLVAILAENGILRAETLRFADELRSPEDVGLPEPAKPTSSEVKRMTAEIKRFAAKEFDSSGLVDKSSERLRTIVEKKLEAEEDVVRGAGEVDEDDREVIDLVEMLQRSLSGGRAVEKAANTDDGLDEMTKADLYERAQEMDISGRSSMNRKQLVAAIRKADA